MKQKTRWQQRLENFEKAFSSLTIAVERIKENPNDEMLRAGFIQTYEFNLELAWKTLSEYLQDQGFGEISSPKNVFRTAFQAGYVKEGELWMEAIRDRNLTVHTYNEGLAEKVKEDILGKYYFIIKDLYLRLKQEENNE
jgi:nucleotidyltransferase substrate binding protein (TIGR01987 family)